MDLISLAEKTISGEAGDIIVRNIGTLAEEGIIAGTMSEQTELYFTAMRTAAGAEELLTIHSDGYELLDRFAEDWQRYYRDRQLAPFNSLVPEFVIAGVEFVRDAYKLIYPIAVNLPLQRINGEKT